MDPPRRIFWVHPWSQAFSKLMQKRHKDSTEINPSWNSLGCFYLDFKLKPYHFFAFPRLGKKIIILKNLFTLQPTPFLFLSKKVHLLVSTFCAQLLLLTCLGACVHQSRLGGLVLSDIIAWECSCYKTIKRVRRAHFS